MIKIFLMAMFVAIRCHSQTCIAVVKTKDRIIVGSDSRVYLSVYKSKTKDYENLSHADTLCKILTYNNFNFCYTGIHWDYFLPMALESMKSGKTFNEVESRFRFLAKKFFTRLIDSLLSINRTNASQYIYREFLNGQPFGMSLFFGTEGDSLVLHALGPTYWCEDPDKCFDFKTYRLKSDTFAIGHIDEIVRDSIIKKPSTWDRGYFKGIRAIINHSSKFNPAQVGGPINIREITVRRSRWIGLKPPCLTSKNKN
jgi:hypothetical protein